MLTKVCTKCQTEKPLTDFPKSPTCVSGFRSYCSACKNEQTRAHYYNNKEQHKAKQKSWQEANPEKNKEIKTAWKKRNLDWVSADNAKRNAIRRSSTVNWDKELTDFVFSEAHTLRKLRDNSTGFLWHVDHVVPLRGKNVCGLHTWNNFAVIPAKQNLRKNNSHAIPEERCPPV